jgi:hypothetical protein
MLQKVAVITAPRCNEHKLAFEAVWKLAIPHKDYRQA